MRLAADANVLLSAILGHAAFRAIDEGKVEPLTTLETLKEVEEHLPVLGEKYGMEPKVLEANLIALGITAYGPKKYRAKLAEAKRLIEAQDPDDVPLLALALTVRLPVWTSDNDFKSVGVTTYTMAELLAKLGIRRE